MRFFVRLRDFEALRQDGLIHSSAQQARASSKARAWINRIHINSFRLARRCSLAPQVFSHCSRLGDFRQRALNLKVGLQQHLISVLDAVRRSH